MANGRIVVIGASIGGVTALRRLAPTLAADFPAPILVVVHVGAQSSILPAILTAAGPLPAHHARDGERLRDAAIYVAPPDHHLLVDDQAVRLLRAAKEHNTRPAIDPLFLSAALTHGPGVIGVVMSGGGDDGTAGLQAIEKCGGVAVVQNPETAEEAGMPLSALKYVRVQHIAHLEEMGALLARLVDEPPPAHEKADTSRLRHELDILLSEGAPMEHLEAIATPSTLSCPDCGGACGK